MTPASKSSSAANFEKVFFPSNNVTASDQKMADISHKMQQFVPICFNMLQFLQYG